MAVKDSEVIMYSVYFLDCGGRLIGEPARVPHGGAAQPPAFDPGPSQELLGWSRPTSYVTENIYCVALTRALPKEDPARAEAGCRVFVLELRGQTRASLFPLGNWAKGETLTRDDLACLHLRRMERLRPFRCTVAGDTLLAITDYGVRAFDTALRPLEGIVGIVPEPQRGYPMAFGAAGAFGAAAQDALLAKEA